MMAGLLRAAVLRRETLGEALAARALALECLLVLTLVHQVVPPRVHDQVPAVGLQLVLALVH